MCFARTAAMTLTDLLPSLRSSLRPHLDPAVWAATARWSSHGDLTVGGVSMTGLAAAYGTPVHVLDEADVRSRCAEYVAAFGAGAVAYSAKAGLTQTEGRWIAEQGLGCYVGSVQDLRTALLAGFPPARIVLHGQAKSVTDLDAAYACGASVVVGTLAELEAVAARAPMGQKVLIRVVPSALLGRRHCSNGLRLGSGTALAAITAVLAAPNLVLAGLDCSIGHQLSRFHTFEASLREAMAFCAVVHARCGAAVPVLNLGGGHAVRYAAGDDDFAVAAFASRIRAMLRLAAERYGIEEPDVSVSPGRAIVARAGLTLHRVTSIVRGDAGDRMVVNIDGAAPDCGPDEGCVGRHTAELVGKVASGPMRPATIVAGSPDECRTVVSATTLPEDLAVGDLVAVAGTGAYHHSREPFLGRPPVLAVHDALVRTVVRRDTLADLLRRAC
jgi:diaminopimelate decarboxylase